MAKKRKQHNMHKRMQRTVSASLGGIAIAKHSDIPGPDVRLVNLKSERVFVPTQAEADLLLRHRYPWATFMSVFVGTGWDDFEMVSVTEVTPHPCLHREIVEQLNDSHQQILLEQDQDRVIGYGWIAMPTTGDIDPEKALRIYSVVQRTADQ